MSKAPQQNTTTTTVGRVSFNKDRTVQPHQAYIGRPSVFGNPYKISETVTREQCIQQFTAYFYANKPLMKRARAELSGKQLLCYCHPKACHGDVIARVCNMTDVEFHRLI